MELKDLLDNPDYVNANTATRKAIFEKYSKNNPDYVAANDETRQAIHQRFGLAGTNVKEPLPEKITDFSGRDFGNMLKQSFTEANQQIAKTGRTPVVGPAVLGAVGETIKGVGALGELATDKAQGITKVGQAITQGAQEANMPAAVVGQVGSYIAPYKLAQKGIQATAGAVPYLRGAVNPATTLGSTGEMAASGALVGGLTTPGGYDERMNEAQLQALMGGGANLALRGVMAAPEAVRQIRTGASEGLNAVPGRNSAFAEVGNTFYPNKTVEPFMKLTPEQQVQALPALEASQQPSSSLFSGFINRAAQKLAPEGPKGGTLVPLEGKGIQAFAEQTTRDFFNKPSISNLGGFTGNIGGAIVGGLTGGPVGAAAGLFAPQYIRALEIMAQRRLQNVAGLKQGFPEQLGAAQQTAGRLGMEASIPKTPPLLGYNTPTGPAKPTLYVGPSGEATTNLAGTQVNMNPGTMVVQTPAAQAAMATTQRVAGTTTPRAPRAPAQPKTNWTMPTAEETYNTARSARLSHQEYEAAADAVKQRTQDILKQARIEGRNLSAEAAENQADAEIRAVRFPNRQKKSDVNPTPVINEPPKEVKQGFEKIGSSDSNIEWDRNTWLGLQSKLKQGQSLTSAERAQANAITKRYGTDPFGSGDITGKKLFNTVAKGENTTPAVVETPATSTITAEQQAKRDKFINNMVPERVKQMEQSRAGNKEEFAEQAKAMKELADDRKFKQGPPTSFSRTGIPYNQQPNPKDVFTERKAVADMVGQVSKGNVTSKNKSIVVRRDGYDAMADDIGITLDWTTAPKASKTIAETRKAMDKWMMDTINKELPELGLYKRRESFVTEGKRYNKELEAARAKMTPEEIAAEKAQGADAAAATERLNKLLGRSKSTPKPTPKTETPKVETTPEPTAAEKSAEAQRILEMIRSKTKKNNPPPGTMSMMTGPSALSKEDIMIGKLKQNFDDLPTGSFTENGIRHEIVDNASYTRMPADVRKMVPDMPKKLYRQIDVATGKVIQGTKSTADLVEEAKQILKQAQEGKKKGK